MATILTDDLVGAEGYALLTGLIVPRPIGWIGSRAVDGVNNLAPYSFFNAVSGDPPTVVFSPGRTTRKDTRDNVLATRVFTVNIVTDETVEQMNMTAASVDPGVDEFALAGLTALDGAVVDAPMVAEARARLECRVTHDLPIGRPDGGNHLIVGEVVAFHIDDDLLDGHRIDQTALHPIGRHAGGWYSHVTDLFEVVRPT